MIRMIEMTIRSSMSERSSTAAMIAHDYSLDGGDGESVQTETGEIESGGPYDSGLAP